MDRLSNLSSHDSLIEPATTAKATQSQVMSDIFIFRVR